jgi:hypothetical protein
MLPSTLKCDGLTKTRLLFLKEHYTLLLPGDPPPKKGKSLILIFEDPFFSFYDQMFPFLKKEGFRVLLGVCPRYIIEKTSLEKEERLTVPMGLAMQDGFFEEKAPFCTWEEIREMVLSGHVEVASGSFSKMNLTFPFVNHAREVVESKKILEEKLPQAITSFLYPFGKKDQKSHSLVSENYTFEFSLAEFFPLR